MFWIAVPDWPVPPDPLGLAVLGATLVLNAVPNNSLNCTVPWANSFPLPIELPFTVGVVHCKGCVRPGVALPNEVVSTSPKDVLKLLAMKPVVNCGLVTLSAVL